MQRRFVIVVVLFALALVPTALPASAASERAATAVTTAANATTAAATAATVTAGSKGGESGTSNLPVNLSLSSIIQTYGPTLVQDVAKKAGLKALETGFNYLIKLAGFDLSGNAELYKRLDALKAQLDQISLQIDQVQKSVNELGSKINDQTVQQLFTDAENAFTPIVAGYRGTYIGLVDANKAYYEAFIAANGDQTNAAVKSAADTLLKARKSFYADFGNNAAKAVWRNIHRLLVGDANSDSIITAKGAYLASKKRYLTAADSLELRTLYYFLQAQEALAYNMAAEASVPCTTTADCENLAGATGVPANDSGLKTIIVDYHNAAVEEARALPPMIPVGVVVDNRGGGSTNNKQEWIVESADMPTLVEQDKDLPTLQEIVRTAVSPQGIDGQPTADFVLPSKQQLSDLLAVDPTASGNRGFPTNGTVTVNQWLASLDTSPNWQAIATRNSPRVSTDATETWDVRCSYRPITPDSGDVTLPKRESTVSLFADRTTVQFGSARAVDGANPGYYIQLPFLTNAQLHPKRLDECVYLARQRAAASPGKQLLATRSTGTMTQDYMAQQRNGRFVAPNVDLSYRNLASLNLGRLVQPDGTPKLGDGGLRYADLTGSFLQNAVLTGTNLKGAKLAGADLTGVVSGDIEDRPASLPDKWMLTTNGYLVGPGADLSHADLSGLDLSGRDLTGVNFEGANLTNTNLSGSTLNEVRSGGIVGTPTLPFGWQLLNGNLVGSGADLRGANLRNVNLSSADLRNVRSGGVDCRGCTLPPTWLWSGLPSGYLLGTRANLTGANLRNLDLSGAILSAANLSGVISGNTKCTGCALPTGWRWTGLPSGYLVGPGANLTDGKLIGLDLSGANLTGATLLMAELDDTNLTNAKLTGADLTQADMQTTTLTRVVTGGLVGDSPFLPANFRKVGGFLLGPNVSLRFADLGGLDIKNTQLAGADLSGVRLNGTRSGGMDCTGCILDFGRVWTGSATGYLVGPGVDLSGANLGTADLTTVDFTGVRSGGVTGTPLLPGGNSPYLLVNGYIVGQGVNLTGANLGTADLRNARLDNVVSGRVVGSPRLPASDRLVLGYFAGPRANLAGAALPGAIMEGVNLLGANLTGANLFAANLAGGNLFGANFTNANLAGSRLTGGLSAVNAAQLQTVDLNLATLAGTDLTDADLTSVKSSGITGTPKLPTGWRLVKGYLVGAGANLAGADLSGADLTGMNLRGANLSTANLNKATLTGVDLSTLATVWDYVYQTSNPNVLTATLAGADLSGVRSGGIVGSPPLPTGWRLVKGYLAGPTAVLAGTDLSGANLSGIDLTGVDFTNADLTNANLTNATLVNVIVTGATVTGSTWLTDNDNKLAGMTSGNLKGVPKALPTSGRFRVVEGYFVGPSANLAGAVFTPGAQLGVSLSATNFTGAVLEGVNLAGATLRNTNFTRARLSGATLAGADMGAATLDGVSSGRLVGLPGSLTPGWKVIEGYLMGPGANLRNAQLYFTDLTGAVLTNADLTGADIQFAGGQFITWSNTICPNGVRQSTPCTPLTGPRATVSLSMNLDRSFLVNVGPDIGGDGWTFTLQQLVATNDWRVIDTYKTQGPNETKLINTKSGTFRIVVDPRPGWFGTKSAAVSVVK